MCCSIVGHNMHKNRKRWKHLTVQQASGNKNWIVLVKHLQPGTLMLFFHRGCLVCWAFSEFSDLVSDFQCMQFLGIPSWSLEEWVHLTNSTPGCCSNWWATVLPYVLFKNRTSRVVISGLFPVPCANVTRKKRIGQMKDRLGFAATGRHI